MEKLRELNTVSKDIRSVDVLFGYCYPSTYRAGTTGLAMHLFYCLLNGREDTSCERYFRYDTISPVLSVESKRPLQSNHVIGFSLTYEQDILHLVQMLELANISPWRKNREDKDPIIIIGGPVVSANPTPYEEISDVFVIGEGDLIISDIIDAVKEGNSREDVLQILSNLEGAYVPAYPRRSIKHLIMRDLNRLFHPTSQIVPEVGEGSQLEPVFGKSLLVEVTRGCGHSCKFCLVGHVCRPRRIRNLSTLQTIIKRGIAETSVDKVALIGSSLGDHDRLDSLTRWVVDENLRLSVPSLRADSVTHDLMESIARGGQRTLTIAPETGSENLRNLMGKGLSDSDIYQAVQIAVDAGIRRIKLYFIIGLPGEIDSDVREIGNLMKRLSQINKAKLTASVNPFVPKARTRFEREPQPSLQEIRRKGKIVEKSLGGVSRIELEMLDPRSARIQAALSLGDSSLAEIIISASRYGGLGGWRRAEKETGKPFFEIANDQKRLERQLPWWFICN